MLINVFVLAIEDKGGKLLQHFKQVKLHMQPKGYVITTYRISQFYFINES